MKFAPALLCALLTALLPQARPMASGTGEIAGRVVDAASGAPIAGAQLYMHQTRGDLTRLRSEEKHSGPDGAFMFADLPAGQFQISASAAGYLGGALGKRRPNGEEAWLRLADGERFDRATIELFREATISGVITDETGTPIKEAFVGALRRAQSSPDLYESAGASLRTDAQGRYTIAQLAPGEYVVTLGVLHSTRRQAPAPTGPNPCVAVLQIDIPGLTPDLNAPKPPPPQLPRPVGTLYSELSNFPAPKTKSENGPLTYQTTFYPNVTDIARASSVTVASGERRDGIDFQARPVRATHVRGRAVAAFPHNLEIGDASEIALRPIFMKADHWPGGPIVARGLIDKDGTFNFVDVPPGRYALTLSRASSSGCHGTTRRAGDIDPRIIVDVPPAGLDDVELRMVTPFSAVRRVVMRPTAGTKPTPSTRLSFSRIDGGEGAYDSLNDPDTAASFYPGDYIVRAHDNAIDERWFVASLSSGGVDLTAAPLVVTGPDIKDIVAVMTDAPSRVDGIVTTPDGKPADAATVIAFPIDSKLWARAHDLLVRFARNRALGGRYQFSHLVPGDYFVVAVDEREMGAWPSDAFLKRHAPAATAVRVEPGKALTVSLKIVVTK